ncbi:MAG TPA: SAM-dependent methyltransferase [Prolixibacteraceae bacterium]|nr:SAM-dependent methyltransferase [Prolixibacteraceae bacterium]
MSGKLILIPTTLGETNPYKVLTADVEQVIQSTLYYIVENVRTARRFIKLIDKSIEIDNLSFFEINKRTRHTDLVEFLANAAEGHNIGVMSEAGCPGIADPGSEAVKVAHQKGIDVVPMVGPSSIVLSLMASGMNGQNFTFLGYIPIKQPSRSNTINFIERQANKYEQTQIFIETPYRNNQLMEELLSSLANTTRLCVACDLTLETEYIKTKTVKEWKSEPMPDFHKRPAIFLIGR